MPLRTFFLCVAYDFVVLRDVHSQHVYLQEGKLIVVFVCHRTVSMDAVYQLKIKYDQDKFGVFFRRKTPVKLSS